MSIIKHCLRASPYEELGALYSFITFFLSLEPKKIYKVNYYQCRQFKANKSAAIFPPRRTLQCVDEMEHIIAPTRLVNVEPLKMRQSHKSTVVQRVHNVQVPFKIYMGPLSQLNYHSSCVFSKHPCLVVRLKFACYANGAVDDDDDDNDVAHNDDGADD